MGVYQNIVPYVMYNACVIYNQTLVSSCMEKTMKSFNFHVLGIKSQGYQNLTAQHSNS